jgi:hypothetical protein
MFVKEGWKVLPIKAPTKSKIRGTIMNRTRIWPNEKAVSIDASGDGGIGRKVPVRLWKCQFWKPIYPPTKQMKTIPCKGLWYPFPYIAMTSKTKNLIAEIPKDLTLFTL